MFILFNVGVNDVVDSDVDQIIMFMIDLILVLIEVGQVKDIILDFGLIVMNCDFFFIVMVMCDDCGMVQVNDDCYIWMLQVNWEINSVLDNNGIFILQVMNVDGLEIDVVFNLVYGVQYFIGDEFGLFLILGGDLMFEVKDDIDFSCEVFGIVEVLAILNIVILSVIDCVDDGMGNFIYNLIGQV